MFKNTQKEYIENLEESLRETVKQLEEISQNRSDVHIIKLLPENPDQFFMNGEFVVDPVEAVYGSHRLTFSEEVLFKAGKETAKREYQSTIQQLTSQIEELKSNLTTDASKVEEEISNSEKLVHKLFEKDKLIAELQSNHAEVVTELRSSIKNLEENLEAKQFMLKNQLNTAREETEFWKSKALQDPYMPLDSDIYTKYGIVRVEKS